MLQTVNRSALVPYAASKMYALVADVEMVLAKSDLDIAARYAQLAGDVGARLFPIIQDEHERAVAIVLELREADELLASDPTLQRSIRLRNPYVDPMNYIQVALLERFRDSKDESERQQIQELILQTINGIAAGLQNVG